MKPEHSRVTSEGSRESLDAARGLLACGIVAGPFYVTVGATEMLARPGYDIRRHPLSLLSNGEWAWVNIAMFVISGLLTLAGAFGMRRVIRGSPGGTWGPLLIGVYGLGIVRAWQLLGAKRFSFFSGFLNPLREPDEIPPAPERIDDNHTA